MHDHLDPALAVVIIIAAWLTFAVQCARERRYHRARRRIQLAQRLHAAQHPLAPTAGGGRRG